MSGEYETRWTVEEAAEYIGVPVSTMYGWRKSRKYGPAFMKLGGRIRYRKSDIDRWLASKEVVQEATANA